MKENGVMGEKGQQREKKKLWENTSQTFLLLVHKIYKADFQIYAPLCQQGQEKERETKKNEMANRFYG